MITANATVRGLFCQEEQHKFSLQMNHQWMSWVLLHQTLHLLVSGELPEVNCKSINNSLSVDTEGLTDLTKYSLLFLPGCLHCWWMLATWLSLNFLTVVHSSCTGSAPTLCSSNYLWGTLVLPSEVVHYTSCKISIGIPTFLYNNCKGLLFFNRILLVRVTLINVLFLVISLKLFLKWWGNTAT